MSGRKQHFIPQFILRSFAEGGSGKKLQVRVVKRDRSFTTPTDGIAAVRNFYSPLSATEKTLDDVITEAEDDYAAHFRDIVGARCGDNVDSEIVSRLLVHLGMRGNYIRAATAAAASYAVRRISETFSEPLNAKKLMGVGQPELPQEIKNVIDKEYNRIKPELTKKRISRHEFRRIARKELGRRWEEIGPSSISEINQAYSMIDFAQVASEAHNNVLNNNIEPQDRVKILSSLSWKVVCVEQPVFVLPDCIALSHDKERGVMPAAFASQEELSGVIFPVSPKKAVCAGIYQNPVLVEALTRSFGKLAALASWEFVIVPPSYHDDEVEGSLIGLNLGTLLYESTEKAVSEKLML